MAKAGLDTLREEARELLSDPAYLVASIYRAMEYERRESGD
jgi:hypothetical protein